MERKRELRRVVPPVSPHVLHVDYLPEKGKELFALACEKDLEGSREVGERSLPERRAINKLGEDQES